MDDLAELLVLLHGSESPFGLLHARYRLWRHRERAHAAFVTHARQRDGKLFHLRGGAGDVARSVEVEETVEVWHRMPQHARVEHSGGERDGSFGVRVGEMWWHFDPRSGARSNAGDPAVGSGVGSELGVLLEPRGLLGPLRFAVLGRGRRLDRPVLIVDAWPRPDGRRGSPRDLELRGLGHGAERYRLEIDAERGLVLAAEAFAGGELFQVSEALALELDREIDDERFLFKAPAGEKIRSPGDERRLRRHVSIPEAQAAASFTLLVPTRVPEDWRVHCTYIGPSERPAAPAGVNIDYSSQSGHESLALTLRSADEKPDPDWLEAEGWERVRAGEYAVRVAGRGEGRGPQSELHLEHDGTRVLMTSWTLSGEQLTALAATLAPAPAATV